MKEGTFTNTTTSSPLQVEFSSRDLRLLIVPLIIEQFLALTVGLADSLMWHRWERPP